MCIRDRIYIICYIIWDKTKPCHHQLPWKKGKYDYDVLQESCDTFPPNDTPPPLDGYQRGSRFESEDALLRRAEDMNKYKPASHQHKVTVVAVDRQEGTASLRQTNASEDSGLRSVQSDSRSGSNNNYGSTGETKGSHQKAESAHSSDVHQTT